MTEANIKNPSKPVLGVAEPQLFVSDIRASRGFYREKLGFQVRFVYGEPPFYPQLVRDAASGISDEKRPVSPAAEVRSLGRPQFHLRRSRQKSDRVLGRRVEQDTFLQTDSSFS